ncbi:transporter [Sphingobacterium mizutaii NBRC 14946 = DSM 11724]|uniref:Outer membrane protein oprM n=2 Tax=Sphingobacterium mizutaii TaxID=1010 RepID=A0AAJ4XD25_9SPHI|nr:TolC family protein [Sphingobacterium mizutaii]GEM69571.1 transporter [Sphingobacterium mizutaii NBRC 14946 = DSM 11724]SDL26685.1 Outer membrane protein TolC [Sphingobacterium mizutaii]SNV53417.1 Outer membrane protein oprM precursor [Sphingobacterium mizutaii]
MNKTKLMALMVAGMLSGSLLHAQETLTLQEAVKFALENKAEAKKAMLDLENSEYQIDEVRAGALPQINGSASVKYNAIIPSMPLEVGGQTQYLKMGQPWNSTAGLSVNQQIFNQSLFTGLKAARTTREFYTINRQLTDETLIEKVANAYYDVFQTQLQLETIDNNLENTNKTKTVIEGLVTAGIARQIDLDRIIVNINNLVAQRQIVVNALELKENALKFAIGMPIETDIELPEETFDVNLELATTTMDLAGRTEIKLMEKQAELLELNRKSMKAAYYPSLSFGGDIGYQGFGQGIPGSNDFKWFPTSGLGLNLSIPIFNGGSTKAKINQATIQIKQLEVDMEDTRLGLNLANENAKAQIKNSLLTVDANRRNVQLSKEVLEDTQNNYRNGLATLTELLDAENALATAENNLNTSLLNYKIAEVQLIKANGQLKSLVNE